MEKTNNIRNEAPPVIYNQDDITRCVECNLICLLKLNYKEGKPFINYECENGHKGNILLKDYINQFNKFSISKEKCGDCKKSQKEIPANFRGDDFYYWIVLFSNRAGGAASDGIIDIGVFAFSDANGLALVVDLEQFGMGAGAEATANAEIGINNTFFSHDFSS